MTGGDWKKCIGMNRNGKCVAPNHLGHKKVWGTWYGQVPSRKATQLQRDKRKKKERKKKRWWE